MLKKIYLGIFFVFLLLLISFSFLAYKVNAQVPGFRTPPCDDDGKNPEFNSLRPYQSAPCGEAPKAEFCGNIVKIVESRTVRVPGHVDSTYMDWAVGEPYDRPKAYSVDLSEVEFPILGNTEDVKNSQNGTDLIDDAAKVNEYVSWYLSGVNNKAEYGDTKNTANELVNFSGPLQKLLPGAIQDALRIKSIENSTKEVASDDDETEEVEEPAPANHNQIVVCARQGGGGFLGKVQDILGIGKSNPVECYSGNDSGAQGDVERLEDWVGDLSVWNTGANGLATLFDAVSSISPFISRGDIEESIGNHWNSRMPPLPWSDENGKPFEKDILYQKAYNEWRGKTCVIVPVVDKLLCFENVFVPNKYADLYKYIPLSNTADKNAKMPILTITIQAPQSPLVSKSSIVVEEPSLFYPHTYEVKELSEALNKTYLPQGTEPEKSTGLADVENNRAECRTVEVRSNPGDNLFPEKKPADIMIQASFHVQGDVPCQRQYTKEDPKTGILMDWSECTAEVYIEIHTSPTKVPWADEIWNSTVAGSASTFRKIFPKVGGGSPVSCIADIPSVSKAVYTPVEGASEIGVEGPSGSVDQAKMDPQDAKIYFPHLGGVYEYFLKGIQTALRPKGLGDTLTNGKYCKVETPKECEGAGKNFSVPAKFGGAFKSNFVDLANRWTTDCPGADNNLAEECYDFIVDKATKEGVNPAFALTIWLNESGASNYCHGGTTTQDMGINLTALYQDIVGQAEAFMKMANMELCSGVAGFTEPMHGWLSRFQSSDGICDPNDKVASDYYYAVKDNTWSFVTSCAKDGKFGLTWPTDSSCP